MKDLKRPGAIEGVENQDAERQIDKKAILAANDELLLENLISEEKAYILACAGRTLVRHVYSGSEEELIAIEAFVEAVKAYSFDKGSFLSFANLVIKRRLIDDLRSKKVKSVELPIDPSDLNIARERSEAKGLSNNSADPGSLVSEEIESLGIVLKSYGFSFFDLVDCSPKAQKTKEACGKAIKYLAGSDILYTEMRSTKLLPIKIIEKNTGVPRKILERHRKYIIAISEILNGNYACLESYVKFIKEL